MGVAGAVRIWRNTGARLTLPVRVLGVRAGRKAHGLVACAERDVEPAEEGVNVCERDAGKSIRAALLKAPSALTVVTSGRQLEVRHKVQVGLGNRQEIESLRHSMGSQQTARDGGQSSDARQSCTGS